MGYVWEFGVVFNQFDLLLAGLLNTLKITGGALLFGIPLGLLQQFLGLVDMSGLGFLWGF